MEATETVIEMGEIITAINEIFPVLGFAIGLLIAFAVLYSTVLIFEKFEKSAEEFEKIKNEWVDDEAEGYLEAEKPKNDFKPKRDVRLMLNEDGEFTEDLPL